MAEKPSPTTEFDIDKWGGTHVIEVNEASSLLNESKALVIEGPVHSGKTSLVAHALAASREASSRKRVA